jgi:hypothetical protein
MFARPALIVSLVIVIAGSLAARAGAATRLVATTGSDAANTCLVSPCKTVAHAVSVASANDTISIGPGTYAESVTANVPLSFVGAGAGTAAAPAAGGTFLDAAATSSPALTMFAGGSVSGLRLLGGPGIPGPLGASEPALQISNSVAAAAAVSDCVLLQSPTSGPSSPGGSDGALTLEGAPVQPLTATVQRVTIVAQNDGIDAGGAGLHATIDHATITGGRGLYGISASAGASVTVTNTTASSAGGEFYGAGAQNDTLNVDHSVLSGTVAGVFVHTAASAPAVANVTDSVLEDRSAATSASLVNAAAIVDGSSAGDFGSVNLTGVTAVAYGPYVTAAVLAFQGSVAGASANLNRTIAFADDTNNPATPAPALKADATGGPADIVASHSLFATSSTVAGGSATAAGTLINATGDPHFANLAAGDYHLTAGSAAIDIGDSVSVNPGETDLDGAGRSLPGTCGAPPFPDAGAYEFPTPPCPIVPISTPVPPSAPKPLKLSKVSLSPSHLHPRVTKHHHASGGATLHFTLSGAASLRGVIQLAHRRKHHHTTYTTVGHALKLKGRSGTNRVTFTAAGLKPGSYHLTLTATAGKATAKPVTVSFTVLAAVRKRAHH